MATIEPVLVNAAGSMPLMRVAQEMVGARLTTQTVTDDGLPAAVALPLPTIRSHPVPARRSFYAVSAVDAGGRVADRSPLRELNWPTGRRIKIRLADAWFVVWPDPAGDIAVTGQGHLHIPAYVRHTLHLRAGDRVLLGAHPDEDTLTVYPTSGLDALLLAGPPGGRPL